MPTRNLILWIIAFIVITTGVFSFFYFRSPSSDGGPTDSPNFIATSWPFRGDNQAQETPTTSSPSDISGYEPPDETNISEAILVKVSQRPIAGYGVFQKERYKDIEESAPEGEEQAAPETEFVPFVRYTDKITGNIYQSFADELEEKRFTDTAVPGLHEAHFGSGGSRVIMRYLSRDGREIETFLGGMPEEFLGGDIAGEYQITGSYLPERVLDVSISPDFSKFFYLLRSGDGVVGITAQMSGEGRSQIFESPFTEWLSHWPNDRMITLATKPSYLVEGYVYSLDPETESFSRVLGGIKGLIALSSPSGRLILYADNTMSLSILNRNSGEAIRVGLRTMPEKCVWGKDSARIYCAVPRFGDGNNYPDIWYQGEMSFTDRIWEIDPETGNAFLLADPINSAGEEIDALKLMLDQEEKYLFFVNKRDSTLWRMELI